METQTNTEPKNKVIKLIPAIEDNCVGPKIVSLSQNSKDCLLLYNKYSNEKLLKSICKLKKIATTDTNSIRDNNFNIFLSI